MNQRSRDKHKPKPGAGQGHLKAVSSPQPPPKIDINAGIQDLPTISQLAWNALEAANHPPTLFQFGGSVCRIQRDSGGILLLKRLNQHEFRHHLARSAHWCRMDQHGNVEDARPPDAVCQDMLASPHYPLPVVMRIVEAPVYADDGTVVTGAGYHPRSLTYFDKASNLQLDQVPQHPTAADVKRARELILDDLLSDFPFVSESDRAHLLALLLLPFVRNLIDGPTPLHLIESPVPGSGKGLAATVALIPAIGRDVTIIPPATSGEETRKRLTAALSEGVSVILLDNYRTMLDSAELAAALTARVWKDRILGRTEMVTLPIRCAWVCTANNPVLSTEIARRSIRIRIDPINERPWQRDQFRHPDLAAWAIDHRSELIWAVLIMVNEWLALGKPLSKCKRLGSFERWSDIIGGILGAVAIPGFLDNQNLLYEAADLEGAAFKIFVEEWWDEFQDRKVSVSELFPVAEGLDSFELPGPNEQARRIFLGKEIARHRDRVFGNWRIMSAGTYRRAVVWKLNRVV